ncbi:MAG: hypothetical protein A2008_02380 [Candidatus Wallbacteria bacterium GWC2_49_35]|uniref:DUF58 domain-containing protein n=1 Tax=Candidatus Wallbacteria bacterium GWC2_49_35 TaxID=1817813 RepID=A0A1F7WH53_9BACT|nr:MAG: hypothetical protein A2008_02380 [Candidatus Wallbacteria bacterium GWC2_49_35]HBC74604.1 DUF58 domain-containing protein [Candidatus Wallbacteria bacterium]
MSSNNVYKYFNPAMLAGLQNLKLAAGRIVDGFLAGMHKSHFRGFNVEFSQHRQYIQGDEIKNIDWKIFAKTDKYYVKEFEEDTNLKAHILLDCSSSMMFNPGHSAMGPSYSKFDYACFLAIALSYIILKQQDSVGLITFSDRVLNHVPASSNASHFKVLLEELERAKLNKKTALSESFNEVASRIKRRGLIIVISDLYDDENQILKSLKHFRHKHHEVAVFHLLSDFELTLPVSGETQFVDLENSSQIVTNAESLREDYMASFNKFIAEFKSNCLRSYIDYNMISTATPIDRALNHYLVKRARS